MTITNQWTIHAPDDAVLMEQGSWKLRRTSKSAQNLHQVHSYITHQCSTETFYWWNVRITANSPCPRCSQRPPRDMMGVWYLHNFEYVQRGTDPE